MPRSHTPDLVTRLFYRSIERVPVEEFSPWRGIGNTALRREKSWDLRCSRRRLLRRTDVLLRRFSILLERIGSKTTAKGTHSAVPCLQRFTIGDFTGPAMRRRKRSSAYRVFCKVTAKVPLRRSFLSTSCFRVSRRDPAIGMERAGRRRWLASDPGSLTWLTLVSGESGG